MTDGAQGPVGKLLKTMQRHVFRPAHLHLMFQVRPPRSYDWESHWQREGFDELITSLYFKGDIFLTRWARTSTSQPSS